MLNKQNIKNLIASSLVGYHKEVLPVKINELINTHNVEATNSRMGHMTAEQVQKLEAITHTDAEVNQNAFSNVKVGTTTIAADAKTDTVEIAAGDHISITADAASKKVTIAGAYEPFDATTEGLVPSPAGQGNTNFLSTEGWKEIQNGTTSAKGIVQLEDSIKSTDAGKAATAKSVKDALDAAKSYADAVKSEIYGGAPSETLDTITEISDALNKDKDGSIINSIYDVIGSKANANHTHLGSDLAIGTYTLPDAASDVAVTDTIAAALAKVDRRARTASAGSDKWNTARTITFKGAVTGSVSIDGSKNVETTLNLSDFASNKVTAMTNYAVPTSKPANTAIVVGDTLNAAIGKLEYRLNNTNMDSMIATLTGDKTLANYNITDAYAKDSGEALEARMTTMETLVNTTLNGAETVNDSDVTAIIEAVKTGINA